MSKAVRQFIEKEYRGDYGGAVRNLHQVEEDIQFERAKKMLKDNGNRVTYHRWYKGEKFNYLAYGAEKGKVTGYFKQESRTRGTGGRRETTYYKFHETGVIIYINETMCKMGIIQGLQYPRLLASNKVEWNKAYRNFIKLIS